MNDYVIDERTHQRMLDRERELRMEVAKHIVVTLMERYGVALPYEAIGDVAKVLEAANVR